MPCERPGISPITDECCFSCFTEGRLPYAVPIAIVLHEVDEHIEALNNRMENCCNQDPDCHSSFHYGVGHDGLIINWVDPANTAWSFDPINSDQNCGVCGWSIATQEGSGVNPNLYTINIAVTTGILAFDQSSFNSLAENNYTENQYEAIVRLTGWLAETYNIIVNQNTIWRHCDELDDFPAGCCGDCNDYSDFLEDVQECIDSSSTVLPWLCDAICDGELQPGAPVFVFGADAECNACGRYQLGPTTQENFCDLMAAVLQPEGLPATPGLEVVMSDCTSWLMPTICELMAASNVATGDPITDQSVSVLGADCQFHTIDLLSTFDLCAEVTAAFVTDGGEAVPGQTNLLGLDCQYYQVPDQDDLCQMLFEATDVFDETLNLVMIQRNQAGDECRTIMLDNECTDTEFIHQTLGVARGGELKLGRAMASMPVQTITSNAILDPGQDGLTIIDAANGSVELTLVAPADCEPNMFMIKRIDDSQNVVTINGGANTIDGVASFTLTSPHQVSGVAGEGITVVWTGANWVVI